MKTKTCQYLAALISITYLVFAIVDASLLVTDWHPVARLCCGVIIALGSLIIASLYEVD